MFGKSPCLCCCYISCPGLSISQSLCTPPTFPSSSPSSPSSSPSSSSSLPSESKSSLLISWRFLYELVIARSLCYYLITKLQGSAVGVISQSVQPCSHIITSTRGSAPLPANSQRKKVSIQDLTIRSKVSRYFASVFTYMHEVLTCLVTESTSPCFCWFIMLTNLPLDKCLTGLIKVYLQSCTNFSQLPPSIDKFNMASVHCKHSRSSSK